jgi:hypothetical protein
LHVWGSDKYTLMISKKHDLRATTGRFRVRKILVLTIGACIALTALAAGDIPPPRPAAPNFEALVEQLGDDDADKRELALHMLETHGVAALPALRKAINHPDVEIRRRVVDLIPTLELAAILSPKRINLKLDNKTLREVFDEVTRQSDLKIECWANNPQQTHSFDLRNVTFWEAVDRISRDTGMVVQQGYGDDKIRLAQQNGYVPHIAYDGAFRYTANNIHQSRSVDLSMVTRDAGPGRRQESLTFSFTIFVEPRLSILGLGDVKLTAAYDNEKNSLLPPQGNSEAEGLPPGMVGMRRWSSGRYGNRATSYQAQVVLNRPSEKASLIKSMRGSVPVNLLAVQKPVVVAEKIKDAKGKKVTIDSTTIHIGEVVEQPNKQFQVKLGITEDNKEPNDNSWMNTMYQRIQLFDDKGNQFQVYGTSWGNSGPNHVELTFTYGQPPNVMAPGVPTKLVFMSWQTVTHQVNFEFKDIPLP